MYNTSQHFDTLSLIIDTLSSNIWHIDMTYEQLDIAFALKGFQGQIDSKSWAMHSKVKQLQD